MTIPKYHEIYKPFLDCLRDGKKHSIKVIKELVANEMKLAINESK